MRGVVIDAMDYKKYMEANFQFHELRMGTKVGGSY